MPCFPPLQKVSGRSLRDHYYNIEAISVTHAGSWNVRTCVVFEQTLHVIVVYMCADMYSTCMCTCTCTFCTVCLLQYCYTLCSYYTIPKTIPMYFDQSNCLSTFTSNHFTQNETCLNQVLKKRLYLFQIYQRTNKLRIIVDQAFLKKTLITTPLSLTYKKTHYL